MFRYGILQYYILRVDINVPKLLMEQKSEYMLLLPLVISKSRAKVVNSPQN